MAYWWCLKHKRVERAPRQGWFHGQRLGPFDTESEAARALEIVNARNEEQDAADRDWREGHPEER